MKINLLKILVALVILMPGLSYAEETVKCGGHNSETQSYVHGECSDGNFDGFDSLTGSYVYGRCEPGEDLEAFDHKTNVIVNGICGTRL